MDNSKIINVAHDILKCTEEPFLLVVPEKRNLAIFSNYRTAFANSVTCRFDTEADNNLRVFFNDKSQPKLPENTAILSGTCRSVNEIAAYFNLELDNGGRCNVCYCDSAAEHFKKELKVGDRLKIRIYFDFSGLTIREVDDILSHTRTETSTITIDLKE